MSNAADESIAMISRHRSTSITKTALTLPNHHSNQWPEGSVMCHVPLPSGWGRRSRVGRS